MSDVFKTKAEMPPENAGSPYDVFPAMPRRELPEGTSVAVTMTPEQDRQYRATSYPNYEAMSVKNITRPRFGHGY